MKILDIYRGGTVTCYGLSLGRFLLVHWHVGYPAWREQTVPRIRLRGIFIFGYLLPFRYYVD